MSQFKNFFDYHAAGVKTPISNAAISNGPHSSGPTLTLGVNSASTKPHCCRVAILVGEGVDSDSVKIIYSQLSAYGASPRLVGCGRGNTSSSQEITLDVDASLGAAHAMLYDAVVLIADEDLAVQFVQDIHIYNFVRQQYRCCKPMLVIGAATGVVEKFDISAFLPSGLPDPAIVMEAGFQLKKAVLLFKQLLPLVPSEAMTRANNK